MQQEVVFWQHSMSIHQSALLRSLATDCECGVSLAVWEELNPGRRSIGWEIPDTGQVQVIVRPDRKQRQKLLLMNTASTLHVFSGPRGDPFVRRALDESMSTPAIIALYAEACRGQGPLGFLRFVRSRYDANRWSRRVSFFLAIGGHGTNWYIKSGYPSAKVFPFAYFVERPERHNLAVPPRESSGCFNIVYIGQLIRRKGWDTLLRALAGLEKQKWKLHVVGNGRDQDEFGKMCGTLGLLNSVISYGALPNPEAVELLGSMDLLVLPSRWDGWGAVVNEALMSGVPVLASNQCGASVLLDGSLRGEVFDAGSVRNLHEALNRCIARGPVSAQQRESIIRWSACISGESGARYFRAIMKCAIEGGERPVPPWMQ